jgi:fumarate reductase subunit D
LFDILLNLHSGVRWLVLVALVVGIVLGWLRYRAGSAWNASVQQIVVMVVDIQIAIGAVLWVFYDGWDKGAFYAVIHPVVMLGAVAVMHMSAVIARKRSDARSWLIMSGASLAALVLIVAAIPWDRL